MKLSEIDFRDCAIVLYKDKIYADVNHQYAFELALNDNGQTMGLDLDTGDLLEAEAMIEQALHDGKVTTWHWFSKGPDNYLICNFEDDFFENYESEIIQSYADEYCLRLGFVNEEWEIILLDEIMSLDINIETYSIMGSNIE